MSSRDIRVMPYNEQMEADWNRAVESSKNGTFLFDRRFMDYHRDRFCDCSLVFLKDKRMLGVLPANLCRADHTVYSHQGLTYGGLVLQPDTAAADVMQMMDLACDYFRQHLQATRWVYRPVPYIYHRYPSDEPLYALFRHGARLTARGLSSAVLLDSALPLIRLRRRGVRKAEEAGISLSESTDMQDIRRFWKILRSGLQRRHGVEPVHTAEEIKLLTDRLPRHIRLVLARRPDGEIMGGAWLFCTDRVVHVQYMAASDEGRTIGVNDLLTATLIRQARTSYSPTAQYYEFGISTEQDGHVLNEGLIFQKEGFGARGVCYDAWELALH